MTNQRGTAVITALFIMTIVAMLGMALAVRLQTDIRRTELLVNANQLYYAAQTVRNWAITILVKNAGQRQNGVVFDPLPVSLPPVSEDNITITGTLSDLQARFNINNLINSGYAASFTQLIKAVSPSIDPGVAENITNTIIFALQKRQSDNRHLFSTVTELDVIPGIPPGLLQQLEPYITALPETTAINVNTAPLPVLMSLGHGLTREQASMIIKIRDNSNGIKSVSQLLNSPGIQGLNISAQDITTTSDYFLAQGNAHLANQHLSLFDIIHRVIKGYSVQIVVLGESRGL